MSGRFPRHPTLKDSGRVWSPVWNRSAFFLDDNFYPQGSHSPDQGRKIRPGEGVLEGACDFDTDAFDFTMREGVLMDPQFRVSWRRRWGARRRGICGDDSIESFTPPGANTYASFYRRSQTEQLGFSQITTPTRLISCRLGFLTN